MPRKNPSFRLVAALATALPALAFAAPVAIGDYAVFGGNSTSIGSNVNVNQGLVGGNDAVSINGGAMTLSVQGGGALGGGTNLDTGNIVFSGNVTVSGGSVINGDIDSGGNVSLGNNVVVTGHIRAAGTVTLGGSTTVQGNVDAGAASGVAIQLGNGSTIAGAATHLAGTTANKPATSAWGANVTGSPAAPNTFSPVAMPAATVFSSGSTDLVLGGGSALSMTAGSYRDLTLGNSSHLTLTAGNYYFDDWTIGGGSTINFDATGGDINLFFTGNANLGNNVVASIVGGDAGDVYAEVLGNWDQNGGGEWHGTVFASGAGSDIHFGNNSVLSGAFWARDRATIDGGSSVDFVLADRLTPSASAVPEPGSLALVGMGLLTLVGARRRAA